MGKIELKICVGTLCYVMGGAELYDVIDNLPPELKEQIEIAFSSCSGWCEEKQEPPFVELNGKKIGGVTKSVLLQKINEELENVV